MIGWKRGVAIAERRTLQPIHIICRKKPTIMSLWKWDGPKRVDVFHEADSHIHCLCELCSLERRNTGNSFGRSGGRQFFCDISFDKTQPQHRLAWDSKSSNKKFLIRFFQACDLKTQQRHIFHERMNITKKEPGCLLKNCSIFSKVLIESAKIYRFLN